LASDLGLGGKPREIPPEVVKSKDRVRRAIDRAISDIRRVHIPAGRHLDKAIKRGFKLEYRDRRTWLTDR
jgi:hypothetical protein